MATLPQNPGQAIAGGAAGSVMGPVGTQLGAVLGGSSPRNRNNDSTLSAMLQQMQALRTQAQNGQISDSDYSSKISDLVSNAWNFKNQFASKGSQYANQANPQWGQIVQQGFATNNGTPFTQAVPFKGEIYADSPALKNIVQSYTSAGKGQAQAAQDLGAYATTFRQMFASAVGRDPTAQEYDQFFSNVVQNDQPWTKPLDQTQLRQETSGLLSQFYQGEAQKTAQQKLQDQATAAVAPGSAFDQWQQSYKQSLNDVEKSLTDYSSKIMDQIRPQLLTSLKAQGLMDSGALNEAFAGKASDLTSAAQNYMAQARTGAATDIANQKYNVMSAPTNYAMQSAFGSVPNLTQSGQQALQNVYGNMANTNMANLNNQFQMDAYNRQLSSQPSLLSQYGGMILGGTAAGLGQGLAKMPFGGA